MDPMDMKKIKEQLLEKLIDDLDMMPMDGAKSDDGEMSEHEMPGSHEMAGGNMMSGDEMSEGEGMPPEIMERLKAKMMGADKGSSMMSGRMGMNEEDEENC